MRLLTGKCASWLNQCPIDWKNVPLDWEMWLLTEKVCPSTERCSYWLKKCAYSIDWKKCAYDRKMWETQNTKNRSPENCSKFVSRFSSIFTISTPGLKHVYGTKICVEFEFFIKEFRSAACFCLPCEGVVESVWRWRFCFCGTPELKHIHLFVRLFSSQMNKKRRKSEEKKHSQNKPIQPRFGNCVSQCYFRVRITKDLSSQLLIWLFMLWVTNYSVFLPVLQIEWFFPRRLFRRSRRTSKWWLWWPWWATPRTWWPDSESDKCEWVVCSTWSTLKIRNKKKTLCSMSILILCLLSPFDLVLRFSTLCVRKSSSASDRSDFHLLKYPNFAVL